MNSFFFKAFFYYYYYFLAISIIFIIYQQFFNNISFQTNEKEEKYLLLAPFFRFSHTLLFSFQIFPSKKNLFIFSLKAILFIVKINITFVRYLTFKFYFFLLLFFSPKRFIKNLIRGLSTLLLLFLVYLMTFFRQLMSTLDLFALIFCQFFLFSKIF